MPAAVHPLTARCTAIACAVAVLAAGASAAAQQPQQRQPPPPPRTQPQPPPGYGQPAQPPPQQPQPAPRPRYARPAPPPAEREPRRHVEPYEQGMALPPNAEIVQRRKTGLWVTGLVLFGVWWVTTAALWTVANDTRGHVDHGEILIPVAGPIWRAIDMRTDGSDAPLERMAAAGLVFSGLAQAAGVVMFSAGIVKRDYVMYWASDSGPNVALLPSVGPGHAGLSLTVW